MSTFHRVEHNPAKLASGAYRDERLPAGQAVAVIAGLSVLSWAVLICVALGFSAVL